MSIYIEGFDIPQDGIVRVIMIESDGSVRFYGGSSVIARAIEVPPCGRLGDLDALALAMMDAKDADQALAMVDDAPTIIPADREEAETALKEENDG